MADVKYEVEHLKTRQREVFKKIQALLLVQISECVEIAELRTEGFEYSDEVIKAIEDLLDFCKPSHTTKPEGGTTKRKRTSSEEKMKFFKRWLSERDESFTHKTLGEAFRTLNNGKPVQRTYYTDQLQALINAGVVNEENVGEGHERPRLEFTKVAPVEQEITDM